ncbi:MAG: hypothetical protein ACJ77B_10445 [Chloroflexota bacterium]
MGRRLLRGIALALAVVAAGGCSDWPNGLPVVIRIANWTDRPIRVEREPRGGATNVIVERIEPFTVRGIDANGSNVACEPGAYVARDISGIEIARLETQWCDAWVVAVGDIPLELSNATDSVVSLAYARGGEITQIGSLKPTESLSSTINAFGAPSDLCLSGELVVTVGSEAPLRSPIRDCRDWVWTIREVSQPESEEVAKEWLTPRLPSDAAILTMDSRTRSPSDAQWDVSSRVELTAPSLGEGTFQACFDVTIDKRTGWTVSQGQYGPVHMASPKDRCGY